MAGEFGCTGLVVDAKPEAVSFYERYGFIAHDALEGLSDSRPQPRLMFLPLPGNQRRPSGPTPATLRRPRLPPSPVTAGLD